MDQLINILLSNQITIIFLYLMIFFLGASLGSFSLVIVRRGHNNDWKSWLTGKSKCEACGKTLVWWELIPFVSFLVLRGKCSKCKEKIDKSHFITETFAGIVYLILFTLFLFDKLNAVEFAFMLISHIILIALSASDFLYREINVIPVYILGIIGLTYNAIVNQAYWNILIVVAMFVGFGILCAKDNFVLMGSGDIDVVVAIFALLGSWFGMIDVIIYAALAGIVIFATLYRKSEESIPFVPCLYFGYFLASMDISVSQAISDALLKLLEM